MDRPNDPASTRIVKQMVNASEVSQERDFLIRQRGVRATAQDAGLWRDIVVDKRVSEEVEEKKDVVVESAEPKAACAPKSIAFALPESAAPSPAPFPWKCCAVGLGLVIVALILLFATRHDARRHLRG
tara:strand:- start:3243 stop:3626 length:384 start_codon:yes stop_codon:yes gene_type:complete